MEYNATLLSLGYLLSEDRQRVLFLYHNAKSDDFSYGKYNGYADFIQDNESSLDCFKRIVFENTGSTPLDIVFRGSVHWANFRQRNKSFFAQIFLATINDRNLLTLNKQGENRWLTVDEVLRGDVPLWQGDKHILPLVFDDNPIPFHGYMPYVESKPQNWFFARA